jgi:hypothetical protein
MKFAKPIMLATATLALAYGAFAAAFATITAPTNPPMALRFDSRHPVALAVTADALASTRITRVTLASMGNFAKTSLVAQAINPRALRLLSTSTADRGDEKARIALLSLSERLSRREFGTQMLLIEKGSQGDGITETLKHYDVALTTELEVKDTLYPILAAAIEDPAINAAFAPYMLTARPWVPEFMWYKYEKDRASNALTDAALRLGGQPGFPEFKRYKQLFFDRAVRTGQIGTAKQFYARFKVADATLLTSTAFIAPAPDKEDGLVRWQLFELPYVVPQFIRAQPGAPYQLSVTASSGARGVIASKLLLLDPGAYRLSFDYRDVDLVPGTVAVWTMQCAVGDAQPLIWQSDGRIPVSGGSTSVVTIPASCGAQTLSLTVTASGEQRDSSFTVSTIGLTRESQK